MSGKIIVYSGSGCPDCRRLKDWLRRNRILFEEKSIEDSEVMAGLVMRDVHLLGVPALEVAGRIFVKYE